MIGVLFLVINFLLALSKVTSTPAETAIAATSAAIITKGSFRLKDAF
jgi:hypothetical protein